MPASQRNADYEVIIRFKLADMPPAFLLEMGDSERPPPADTAPICAECQAAGARLPDGSSKMVLEVKGGRCPCFNGRSSPCSHECGLGTVAVLFCMHRDRSKHTDYHELSCTAMRCAWLGRGATKDGPANDVALSNATPIRFHSLHKAVVMVDPDTSGRVTAYDRTGGGPLEHFLQGAIFPDGWRPYGQGIEARRRMWTLLSQDIQNQANAERRVWRNRLQRKVAARPDAPAAAPPAVEEPAAAEVPVEAPGQSLQDEAPLRSLCAQENCLGQRMLGSPIPDLPDEVARAARSMWPESVLHRSQRGHGDAPASAAVEHWHDCDLQTAAAPGAAAPAAAPAGLAAPSSKCAFCH